MTIKLKSTGESFIITQPTVNLHNYIVGTPYLWYKGDMLCINQVNGDKAIINFKPKGWTSKGDYQCDGYIYDNKGVAVFELSGMWNDHIKAINPYTKEEILLAKKKPNVNMWEKQYFFSKFVINANHLNQKMLEKIAPTDCRLRPDMRALEYGAPDLASAEKHRLEENQRVRKKISHEENTVHKPTWFDFGMEGDQINIRFKGDYFNVRESGKWPVNTLDLFN